MKSTSPTSMKAVTPTIHTISRTRPGSIVQKTYAQALWGKSMNTKQFAAVVSSKTDSTDNLQSHLQKQAHSVEYLSEFTNKEVQMLERLASPSDIVAPKESMKDYTEFIYISPEELQTSDRHFEIEPNYYSNHNFCLQSRAIPGIGRRAAVTGLDTLFDLHPERRSPYLERLLSDYLKNCGDSPLYLYVRLGDWCLDGFHREILTLLAQHIGHFHGIDIQAGEYFALKFFTALDPTRAVILHRLKFDTTDFSSETDAEIFKFIGELPCLKALVYPYKPPINSPVEVWSNLTSINISDVLDEVSCIAFLRQCIRTTDITIQCVGPAIDRSSADTMLNRTVFPLLESLDIKVATVDTTFILDHFTCPALESLKINVVTEPKVTIKRLEDFLGRCPAPLRLLHVFDSAMDMKQTFSLIYAVLDAAMGKFHDERTGSIETFVIFTNSLTRDSRRFYEAWRAYQGTSSKVNLPDLQFWSGGAGDLDKRMRVGWGQIL